MVYWARGHNLEVHFAAARGTLSRCRMDDNTPPVVAGVMAHARGADDVSLARNRYLERISGFDQLLFSPPVGHPERADVENCRFRYSFKAI